MPRLSYSAAHGTVPERVEALRLLEEYPSQASTDACLAGLEDSASEVRAQAARCVGVSADDRAITNLLDLAGAKDPLERIAALEALGRFAPARALSSVEQALADPQPNVRIAAAHALAAYVRAGSIDENKLAPLVRSDEVEMRLAAIALLDPAREGPPAAARPDGRGAGPVPLTAAATDERAAAPATQKTSTRTPNPALIALLRDAARDKAAEVRAAALRALGHFKVATAQPTLLSGLSDADEAVRLSAIAALGDSNLPGAVAPLRATIASDVRAARTALAALGRSDDPSALTALAPALTRSALAQSAVSALIARARRLRDKETMQLSARTLQHAIEARNSARANEAKLSDRDSARPPHANASAPVSSPAAEPGRTVVVDQPMAASKAFESDDAVIAALARGVVELAPYADVQAAVTGLTQALEAGLDDVSSLTQHLMELRAPQLLAALIRRQAHTDAAQLPQLAAAVASVIAANNDQPSLGAAQREELQRLAQAGSTQLRALLDLHDAESPAHRLGLAELWAKLPNEAADRARADQLLNWLDDADPRVRERSSVALARSADHVTLTALAERLERKAPHAELSLQACAGAMLRASQTPGQIPRALHERLLQQFQTYLTQPDETTATSALLALRASRDPRAARWIAGLLRGSSAPLRAAAVQALADFDQVEARRMLRDMLRGDSVQSASNAAIALAEIGSDRDVEALLRAAERGSWPLPPSAAYAAARITQRGATRKHSLERTLCRFTRLRDSYVLANSVAALAALGADACDEQIDPRALLHPALPSALRVAAATWLYNLRPHTPEDTAEHTAALASCAADHDVAVATACTPHSQPTTAPGQTLLRLSDSDGQAALPNRVVALRLPDATVFIGQTDAAGQLLLPRAESGSLLLEDPADLGTIELPAR